MPTFLQFASDTTNAAEYTFSSQNIGTASADRYIIAAVNSRIAGTTANDVSGITIGGSAMDEIVQAQGTGDGNSCFGAIFALNVTSGTTADVVVTWTTTMLRCGLALYSITGLANTTPHDTDSSVADNPSVNLNVPATGHVISCSGSGNNTATASWTELTEDHDTTVESAMQMTSASKSYVGSQTGLAMGVTWTANADPVAVFASWGEAAATNTRRYSLTTLGVG